MDTIRENDRVQPKANPTFKGVVVEAATDGLSGYVHFDSDDEPDKRTFYSAGELDPEGAAALRAESATQAKLQK